MFNHLQKAINRLHEYSVQHTDHDTEKIVKDAREEMNKLTSRLDKQLELQNIAKSLKICASYWGNNVCILGDIEASEIVELCDSIIIPDVDNSELIEWLLNEAKEEIECNDGVENPAAIYLKRAAEFIKEKSPNE